MGTYRVNKKLRNTKTSMNSINEFLPIFGLMTGIIATVPLILNLVEGVNSLKPGETIGFALASLAGFILFGLPLLINYGTPAGRKKKAALSSAYEELQTHVRNTYQIELTPQKVNELFHGHTITLQNSGDKETKLRLDDAGNFIKTEILLSKSTTKLEPLNQTETKLKTNQNTILPTQLFDPRKIAEEHSEPEPVKVKLQQKTGSF